MPEFNGLDVSQEVFDAIEANTAGLKAKNEELITEKRGVKESLIAEQENVKAKQEALQLAEEQRLKSANDMEGLKAHYEKQGVEQLALEKQSAKKYHDLLLARDTDKSKSLILSKVHKDFVEFADAMLDKSMTISYNEKGELVKEFKVDDGVVNTEADFISWASEKSDAWKKVLVGANTSGGGTIQSGSESYATTKQKSGRSNAYLSSVNHA